MEYTREHTTFSYHGVHYAIHQLGTFQVENAVLAVESALRLREKGAEKITEDTIKAGISISRWQGRFDIISEQPYVIADGAHNPDAARRLSESLEIYFKGEKLDFVFGVLEDKDYAKMTEYLCPLMNHVYTVKPPEKRGLSAEELKKQVEKTAEASGFSVEVTACDTVEAAMKQAKDHAGEGRICVCGSLYLVGQLYLEH